MVNRVLETGEGVDIGAQRFSVTGNLAGERPVFAALEEHVLDEMANAGLIFALIDTAHLESALHGSNGNMRGLFNEDYQTIVKNDFLRHGALLLLTLQHTVLLRLNDRLPAKSAFSTVTHSPPFLKPLYQRHPTPS